MKTLSILITILGLLMVLFLLSALGSAMGLITLPWFKFDTQVQTNREIIKKTYNANNVLYNYHWFKERYEEIKATETKIENASLDIKNFEASAGPRSTWTFEDKQEHARLVSIRTGLKNYYETSVGEYNARSKEVDRAIFQDELPTFFSIKPY